MFYFSESFGIMYSFFKHFEEHFVNQGLPSLFPSVTFCLKEYSSLQENPYNVRYIHNVLIIHIYFAPQAVDNV